MADLLRKTVSLGFGVLGLTREKAEKMVSFLVERGEIGKDEAKGFLQMLVERGEQEQAQLRDLIRSEFERFVTELGLATKKDLADLEARLRNDGAGDKGGADS